MCLKSFLSLCLLRFKSFLSTAPFFLCLLSRNAPHPPLPLFTPLALSLLHSSQVPCFPPLTLFTPSVFKPFSCPVYPHMLTGIFLNILNLLWLKLLQYFHSQITQKCSVIVLLSAILIAPPLSGPVSDSKTLLQEMSGAICTWHGLGLV